MQTVEYEDELELLELLVNVLVVLVARTEELLKLVDVVPIIVVVLVVLKVALRYVPKTTMKISAITMRLAIPREIALFALANVGTHYIIVRGVFETRL